ncbi:SRPBCC family protein [Sphingobium sufflavum]|uniref:SRPBCC family protein n=1 Tax=Sphingobium sufflavum TaxID=1129547 RepID=UPI001F3EDEEA|nr:SRPBCC family protein [Sphingobium sufflavum]MCE7798767.1 SRPBCC family protein [Sphingobium sufflavum]
MDDQEQADGPEPSAPPPSSPSTIARIIGACIVASSVALGIYWLIEAVQPNGGLVSFSFLLFLPAAICAFLSYVIDPQGRRTVGYYLSIPLWVLGAVVAISLVLLREGVICVILLSPLWMVSGLAGSLATYKMRKRIRNRQSYCIAILALPLVAMQVEPHIPLPAEMADVSRSIVIAAPPERIWPMLRGIPDVRPDEGRWNITQDVIGVPRPLGARLVGEGVGADRHADWGHHVRFRERITHWVPGRVIAWRFLFDDVAGWAYTDRHLMPNSPYFRVTTGGYQMRPEGGGRTRLTLSTQYRIQTPVNAYSRLWGELFLGDLENNLLALIKARAEQHADAGRPTAL